MKPKRIRFYNIPKVIDGITFDGDRNDLRLHSDNMFNWSNSVKKEYKRIESEINKFTIEKAEYIISTWCDVSGYDYWVKDMREANYIQVSIAFKKKTVSRDVLAELEADIKTAVYFAENLSDSNPYYYEE